MSGNLAFRQTLSTSSIVLLRPRSMTKDANGSGHFSSSMRGEYRARFVSTLFVVYLGAAVYVTSDSHLKGTLSSSSHPARMP